MSFVSLSALRTPRHLLSAAVAAAVLSLGSAVPFAPEAQAAAPMVKTQAPGYYRMMVGDFEVTALSDGTVNLPVIDLLSGISKQTVQNALKAAFLGNPVETSVNAYLVNTGAELILIDTGAAGLFGPTLGNVVANLKASGYQPEQVDKVILTHIHPDHVGGLMTGGQMAFPNATVHVDQADVDFWLSEDNLKAAPEANKGFFQGAMASINPYKDAGKLKPFKGQTELAPGITAVPAYGHTPGHSIIEVVSKGEKLAVWGDLLLAEAVQFTNTNAVIAFDVMGPQAIKARQKAFGEAAKGGYLVAGAHISFPGIGHLRTAANGKGYTFVPAAYTALKK